jgi:hypothetical protein
MINPSPSAKDFSLSADEAKTAQYNAMQTKMMDRESRRLDREEHKDALRDEAEVRAWEQNISTPHKAVVVAPYRY